jgi:hypothetical protein
LGTAKRNVEVMRENRYRNVASSRSIPSIVGRRLVSTNGYSRPIALLELADDDKIVMDRSANSYWFSPARALSRAYKEFQHFANFVILQSVPKSALLLLDRKHLAISLHRLRAVLFLLFLRLLDQ